VETISHVDLIKKGTRFIPKATTMVRAFISNPKGVALFYKMDRNIKDKKVVCDVYNENELVLSY